MKKLICALAAMMLMTGCSAASSAPASSAAAESGTFTPGTFTARAAGRNGDVSTAVTFSAERIEDIRIESQETESIVVEAMNKMKAIVLETQGIDLDNVAGATISASAFIEALNDCVRQALQTRQSLPVRPVTGRRVPMKPKPTSSWSAAVPPA